MKKKVNVGKGLFLLAVFCIMFLGSCMKPEAASRMKKLKVGRTYTTRLTGNEKHKVKFTYTKRIDFDAGVLNLYVDGKLVKRIRRYAFTWEVNLCRVSPKRTLLYLRDCSNNDYNEYMKLLEYKDGRFIELGDLVGLTRNESYEQTDKLLSGWARGHLRKVGANKVVVRWMDTGMATGIFYVDIPYKISGDEVSRMGESYVLKATSWIKTKWTANRSIAAYTSVGGNKKSFSVHKGEKVTGLKMIKKNGTFYFQIRNSKGKKGWFKDSNYTIGQYFKEAVFAG
ncbi:MAG: hypothetical protein HFI80_09900 [Lachnospiraceae bacterium]|jgi:hypothetical protein|uniref:hypothetical protein n=1 Tax=Hominisplanchenecus murintestinalis TaxID=2941517 RepID=UPI00203A470C|nr:hypothetical protein [Hominisplanchenecus murintestinalis]MCI9517304.1 hypothetical protein [Lachnospiraceae bacterium]MCI9661832.1 hypothetical protein [Lachnospiraceae bacterium]